MKLKTCFCCCWIGSPLVHGMKVLLVGDLLQESDCLGQCNRTVQSLCTSFLVPNLLPFFLELVVGVCPLALTRAGQLHNRLEGFSLRFLNLFLERGERRKRERERNIDCLLLAHAPGRRRNPRPRHGL